MPGCPGRDPAGGSGILQKPVWNLYAGRQLCDLLRSARSDGTVVVVYGNTDSTSCGCIVLLEKDIIILQLYHSCRKGSWMSRFDKARQRLLSKPKDYTYSEAKWFLEQLGYVEFNKGKTSGSRVKFYRKSDGASILLHKPHPGDVMKPGSVSDLVDHLKEVGDL